MVLNQQSVNINFSQGVQTKVDPFQLPVGSFLALENVVFTKDGLLTKKYGNELLAPLPDTSSIFLTTFNGNLTALGERLTAYSGGSETWVDRGPYLPVNLNTTPILRNNTNQVQADSVIAANGLVCTVYTDTLNGTEYKYTITDSTTGQNIVTPAVLTLPLGSIAYSPKVFILGTYFIIMLAVQIGGAYRLQYYAISSLAPSTLPEIRTLSTQYLPYSSNSFDGATFNNRLYIAYSAADNSLKVTSLNSSLAQSNTLTEAGYQAKYVGVAVDEEASTTNVYIAFSSSTGSDIRLMACSTSLSQTLAPTVIAAGLGVTNLTVAAYNETATVFCEVPQTYGYNSKPTYYIQKYEVSLAGVTTNTCVVKRSVGLGSKAFTVNGLAYVLGLYVSDNQSTFFLIEGTSAKSSGIAPIALKLAYANGPNFYYEDGLPSVTLQDTNVAYFSYLYRDEIQAVNRNQGVVNFNGIYSQTGVNLARAVIGTKEISTGEIGNNLNLSGGYITSYDGYEPVEQGFFLYPDYVAVNASSSGGNMSAQQYFYQVTYEWTDNQGNLFRSAPSIPVDVTTSGSTSSVVVTIPTLRMTEKTSNPVKIVIYRWSVAQQNYYQVTSFINTVNNDVNIDVIQYTDTLADADILGNNLLYTTGGVLENISPPATSNMTLFQSRLFAVDSEDRNSIWYSKQVIENTPVEFSDFLTIYVAPSIGSQGSTGPITALSTLDDKLLIFKENALYYVTGVGPDNTGANNQFSDPTFITATVGCVNQKSIVFMPQGLMFQSDKGIWLLDRNLATNYIGAPVESFTQSATVVSALNIPGTNQIRFALDSGIILMYDYFFNRWSTFTGVPAISSTLYKGLNTYLNDRGEVLQETVGQYLDNGNPVLMRVLTSWINMAGLQGFQRFYEAYLLGTYITPFKLEVRLSYDYQTGAQQGIVITPDNYASNYGIQPLYGSGQSWGGPGNIFEARFFPQKQQCESYQVEIRELYDPSLGVQAGAGLTLSGINMIVGNVRGKRLNKASRNFG